MNKTQFLFIIVFTFIVVIVWAAADIIFNTKASIPPNPNLPSLLEELNPNFNSGILNQIDGKDNIPALISLPEVKEVEEVSSPISTNSAEQSTNSAVLR